MTKKILLAVIALAMAGTMLVSCADNGGGSATNDKPSTPASTASGDVSGETGESTELKPAKLRLWAHWGSEQRRPTINKMIEGFNAQYKDVGIEAEYVYVPFGELETKLIASVAAGNPANAVISAIEDVGVKAMRKQATDISSYLDPETKAKFYDRYWDTVVYEDGIYGLPFNSDTRMIFYNKKMLETAQVKAEDIKTWDDMLAATAKVDEAMKGKGNFKVAFNPVIGNFGFDAIATTNNATTFDDPMNPNVVTLDSKENVEALDYMKEYANRYGQVMVQSLIGGTASGAQDLFISEQIAFYGQVCNYSATLEKYNVDDAGKPIIDVGVMAHPDGPSVADSEYRSFGGGFVVIVPFGAKAPRESTKLVEYMCGDEASTIWAVEQKDVMCNIAANESPDLANAIGWDVVLELMPKTMVTRRHAYAPNSNTFKDTAINKIVKDFSETDSAKVLLEAKAEIEKKIAEDKEILG